ncbi:DNA-binding MarR family transcriptional regulator [Chitinophaga polysaccharea]|uniref:MarR family transcriptional regulator n=2 Tax=Chitinophaga TaxID=79328 RepID=A0A847SL87_9BACT|nr:MULTISPECIES: MarR family transcriptional regulator [Chitinophaga]NLR57130.1 MarR family transcriptional regulator [Chitinophaga polysaccharea]NLR79935.1 MarR family transcriptional regulator [Chitinophaga eiseniae]NLU91745.1 MarR family transcriptional regulator [Chitinophaga sp. Ak27]TWF39031.1 DNA-binding MarR family transcriptional regulator [Chitinophaga polysaccharea]
MSFYPSLGYLVFGSRLRRLSEYFLMEVNKVYEQAGIAFDASWFPVFYLLSKQQSIPMIDISEQLEISHSAVSQMVTNLKKKGLLKTTPCKEDGRRQLVAFSKKGEELLHQIQPIWEAITSAMNELAMENKQSQQVLAAIAQIEQAVQQKPLSERIKQQL